MVRRLVHMYFQEEKLEDFLQLFEENKKKIRSMPGCKHLELWKDTSEATHLMTYSIWDNEASLENYRNSSLFKSVWKKTKICFRDKPSAESFNIISKASRL